MGRIVVSENISLDGVIQDPTGDEGFAFGGWFQRMSDEDRSAWSEVEFQEALSTMQIELCVERIESAIKHAQPDIITLFVKPQRATTWREEVDLLKADPDEPSDSGSS